MRRATSYAAPDAAPCSLPPHILAELGPDRARQCPACAVWHSHGVIFGHSPSERPDVVLFTRLCQPCGRLVAAGRGGELLEAAADALRPFIPRGPRHGGPSGATR